MRYHHHAGRIDAEVDHDSGKGVKVSHEQKHFWFYYNPPLVVMIICVQILTTSP